MGDHDKGERGRLQQAFQPLDTFDVEMVRRFVQQQHVGLVTSASAMASRLRQPPLSVAASAVKGTPGAPASAKPARPSVSRSRCSCSFSGTAARGERGLHKVANRDPGSEVGDLMHIADADTFAKGNFAGVRLLFAAKNGEQRGLSGAVGANQADAVAVVDGETDVLKERSGAEAFGDVLRVQDRRHSLSLKGTGAAQAVRATSRLGENPIWRSGKRPVAKATLIQWALFVSRQRS